jgi:hypothetical protein
VRDVSIVTNVASTSQITKNRLMAAARPVRNDVNPVPKSEPT